MENIYNFSEKELTPPKKIWNTPSIVILGKDLIKGGFGSFPEGPPDSGSLS